MSNFRALCAELTDRLQHAITSANADSYYGENRDAVDRARAALVQPEPEGVTNEEWFADFADWLEREMPEGTVIGDPLWWASKIADYLQRHVRPAIEPVPVSERLPRREDCDAMGRCWWFTPKDGNPAPLRSADWSLYAGWRQRFTHWLPHHAQPVPATH